MSLLEQCIDEFHECISGVHAKSHTREFIHEQLVKVYDNFLTPGAGCNGPVLSFSIDIYEVILSLLVISNFIYIIFYRILWRNFSVK